MAGNTPNNILRYSRLVKTPKDGRRFAVSPDKKMDDFSNDHTVSFDERTKMVLYLRVKLH
ncbi:MAG: hypothetical protein BGO52_03680 [Sphingobacteriales bacterium 44-61]|nr:MAG: hypothetical protein BGO52_03680 [Sphingobacteriales bacterium 44-61]